MRYIVSIIVSVVIAGALFLVMRSFIANRAVAPPENESSQIVNFVSAPKPEQVQTKNRRPPPKPQQTKAPPQAPKVKVSPQAAQVPHLNINIPNIGVPTPGAGGAGPYLGSGYTSNYLSQNGEAIAIVPIQPTYPIQAQLNGVQGFVTIEFTIQPDGTAANPTIVKAKPRRVFNSAAIQAILRSKFKPKVVDGKAIPVRATYTYRFVLNQNNG